MDAPPYRAPAERPECPHDPGDVSALGLLRSTHAPGALWRALLPALVVVLLVVGVGFGLVSDVGPVVFAVFAPFTLLAFAILAWSPIRRRHLRVALHAHGVVVSTSTTKNVIPFEDVDEVWMILDSMRSPAGNLALMRALRVTTRKGASHRIPLDVQGGADVAAWVIRHCSLPLRADASRALRDGETLTFGDVKIDRDGIRGRSWSARWSELSLARFSPGRIGLFRRQKIIPWRSIRLDRVPHPTIFAMLVRECAPNVDVDDPRARIAS